MNITRRELLKSACATAGWLALPAPAKSAAPAAVLSPAVIDQAIEPGGAPVGFFGFNGGVPGPVLRYRVGDKVRITLRNALSVDTTVHWHGIRVPNAMDGVPQVTQKAVPPGGEFVYEYVVPDSGTFWYHPHQSSFEQVPRGLYGALVVEEAKPIERDRELVWVLSDVKLGPDGQQVEDYGRMLEIANDGRIGNKVLVNGRLAGSGIRVDVRTGERIRLRLVNAASARIFRLQFPGQDIRLIALDGQAVPPQVVPLVDLAPGMRADVVLDCMAAPGNVFGVTDVARQGVGEIARIAYGAKPLRAKPMAAPVRLAPNRLPQPNLAKAVDHYIIFQGGMRGAPVIGRVDGKPTPLQDIMEKRGLAWTMNYTAEHEHALMHEPLFSVRHGEHVALRLINETDFAHPMHLHGHFFRVLGPGGKPGPWRDTALMGPQETLDIAFVADNPGEWMFHCHILDHAAGGMMGTIAVE